MTPVRATSSACRARRRRGAFTLLELVVGVAMTAVVAVSLVTAMSITFRARDSARNQTNAAREATIAMDVIEQEFAGVLAPREGSLLAGAFVGTDSGAPDAPADVVEFYALGRDAGAPIDDPFAEGPRWVQLSLGADARGRPALVRRVDRNLLATIQEEPEPEVLLTGVTSLGLRYYDGFEWLEDWDSTLTGHSLPLAVEVTIEMDDASLQDPEEPYRLVQIIPLACADPEAILAAAEGLTQ